MDLQRVTEFVKIALECSVYVAPAEPGLSHSELYEAGKVLGFYEGELNTALPMAAATIYFGSSRIHPGPGVVSRDFLPLPDPDYRNVEAFQFILEQLHLEARKRGPTNAQADRSVLVERAVANGIPRHDAEVALAVMRLSEDTTEAGGVVTLTHKGLHYAMPKVQLDHWADMRRGVPPSQPNPMRLKIHAVVKDIIARRTDGRPASAEPLDAFADAIEKLGYGNFRMWWVQMVAELRNLDPGNPVNTCVTSAAIVEGALTFVVKHARSLGVGLFGSKDFDRDPRTWKIDDLVTSAGTGNPDAVLDAPTKALADTLVITRQRIHAGRMLSEFPQGVPDLRPEEARRARDTADQVVRRVLDWLEKHPVKS